MFEEGLLNMPFDIAAWSLEPDYPDVLITNWSATDEVTRFLVWDGDIISGGYIPKVIPGSNFPYGLAVEAP